jgi:hypothetical protein
MPHLGLVMNFELTPEEEACSEVSLIGETVLLRPTRRARSQRYWIIFFVVIWAVIIILLASSSLWPVSFVFLAVLAFNLVMLWRMSAARVILSPEGVVVHNMWSVTRIRGQEIQSIVVGSRPNSSLWTYGLDTSWPFSWSPTLEGKIVTSEGTTIRPEALRSDETGPSSVALLKINVLGRWRAAYWS